GAQAESSESGRFTFPVRMLAILLVMVAAAGVVAHRSHAWPWSPSPVAASSRLLVVLPFQAASEEANARAFSAGLAEALVAKLGQIADRYPLEIVALSEVRAQKISDAQQARSVLGASMVLEGSLQVSGNTVRVIYNLIDTRSRRQIHSGVVTA